MKTCPACEEEENNDNERFCMSCGLDLDKSKSPSKSISIISGAIFELRSKVFIILLLLRIN